MPGASNKDTAPIYGLTPREVDLTIKAMITMLDSGAKPDYEKLANMTQYKSATAAQKNWHFTATKLKGIGSNTNGEGGTDNKADEKKEGKRQADDVAEAPPAKRGRARKSAPAPATKDDDDEEEEFVIDTGKA